MGRKRGAKLRADGQEPDRRRCRAGRAGTIPQSSRDQGAGGVNPAVGVSLCSLTCAVKECVLTRRDLALWLKGRCGDMEREVSRGHSSCLSGVKGRRSRRGSALIIDSGLSQMFAQAKLADLENRVKPDEPRQRGTGVAESTSCNLGHRVGSRTNPMTSTTSTAPCGPACRVVWEGSGQDS